MEHATAPMAAAAAARSHVDEVRMEALIASEIKSVQRVLVVGGDRSYLACLLTLKTLPGTQTLDVEGREFASHYGSHATSVDEARQCDHFRAGLLKGFAAANKLVYESNKKLGVTNKAKQLRRFTIVPEIITPTENCTNADRQFLLQRYAEAIESMYDAVETCDKSFPSRDLGPENAGGVSSSGEHAAATMFPAGSTCQQAAEQNVMRSVPAPAPHFVAQTSAEDSSVSQDDTRQASGGMQDGAPVEEGFPTSADPNNHAPSSTASSSHPSPIKLGNRAKASSLVLSKEAKAPLSQRIASSISAIMPCFGIHSQVLDDDILNPGHTIAKRRKSPGKQADKKKAPHGEPVTKCVAKTILVSSSQQGPVGAGSAGTPCYKEDVSAEQALQRAEMISENLPPPPCFKPQVNHAIDLYSSQSVRPPWDSHCQTPLQPQAPPAYYMPEHGDFPATPMSFGLGWPGGAYVAPCPPFVDSHIPLQALSLGEPGRMDNGHVFPPLECGGKLGEGNEMCGGTGDQLLAGQTHGGRAPTSDCLWEQQELAGLSSSPGNGLTLQAPTFPLQGGNEHDFDADPEQMDL